MKRCRAYNREAERCRLPALDWAGGYCKVHAPMDPETLTLAAQLRRKRRRIGQWKAVQAAKRRRNAAGGQ